MSGNTRPKLWPLHRVATVYLGMIIIVLCSSLFYTLHLLGDANSMMERSQKQAVLAIDEINEVLHTRIPFQQLLSEILTQSIIFEDQIELLVVSRHNDFTKVIDLNTSLHQSYLALLESERPFLSAELNQRLLENIATIVDLSGEIMGFKDHNELTQIYWDTQEVFSETVSDLHEAHLTLKLENDALRKLVGEQSYLVEQSLKESEAMHNRPIYFISGNILLSIILPVAFNIIFFYLLMCRISKLDQYVLDISQENFSLPPFRSKDKIGRLALRLNYLGKTIHQLLSTSREHAVKAEDEKNEAVMQARVDPLTGLYNRRYFNEVLERMPLDKQTNQQAFLIFLDLDNFKYVNDDLGHDAGDILLTVVATRLRNTLRPDDVIARIGGDEFAAIVFCDSKAMDIVASRILENISQPIEIYDSNVDVSVSVGISEINADTAPPLEVFKQADSAMYQAKKSGKNKYCYFTPKAAVNQA